MKLNQLVRNPSKLQTHGKYMSPEERFERLNRGERDPRLVKAIALHPEYSYWYSKEVVKDMWPEGERAISKDPFWSYMYAKNRVKGRFLKGEPAIAGDANRATLYASRVIKDRWPEREPAIAKDPYWSKKYNELFGTNL